MGGEDGRGMKAAVAERTDDLGSRYAAWMTIHAAAATENGI